MDEITIIESSQALEALNRSEREVQMSYARKYPRNLKNVLGKAEEYALTDAEIAKECFYSLKRQGKTIEGLSVRMAEIFATCWGNLQAGARIIANDGKTITAQGICTDLESNTSFSVEVKRRITDKDGRTYSEDMQVVTGNAACAIAFRNAVLKVIPKAITAKTIRKIKEVAFSGGFNPVENYAKWLAYFATVRVTEPMVLYYLGISNKNEYTLAHAQQLQGVYTAITEGSTSVQESFIEPFKAQSAKQTAQEIVDFVEVSQKKSAKTK